MPFTTSHPAIVIPLKKLWPEYFSLTGLMAGAMAPDLLYFLMLTTVERGVSHSWTGLYFCIPAAIIFSFAFHYLFKSVFIRNLPSPLDKHLSGLAYSKWLPVKFKEWLVFLISIIIGILSHYFWDSFTHIQGEVAMKFSFLAEKANIFGHHVYYARIAQHLSTILGAFIVAYYIFKGNVIPPALSDYQPAKKIKKVKFWFWGISISLLFALTSVTLINIYGLYDPIITYAIFGLSTWSGFYWYVVIISLIERLTSR